MALNEAMLSLIGSATKWVFDQMGPSKKSLKIQINDLEKQISILAAENQVLINSNDAIVQAVLRELRSSGNYNINIKADYIIITGGSGNEVKMVYSTKRPDNSQTGINWAKDRPFDYDFSDVFERTEREIEEKRRTKPSNRS